jgi:hypothetical protein
LKRISRTPERNTQLESFGNRHFLKSPKVNFTRALRRIAQRHYTFEYLLTRLQTVAVFVAGEAPVLGTLSAHYFHYRSLTFQKFLVSRIPNRIRCFGKRDVHSIVSSKVVTQLPAPAE